MNKRTKNAFTLIELLVVVAIIALLIAILLPSLGRAKANAVRVQCASQLKQWGIVVAMYEQENLDWFGLTWTEADGTTKHPWSGIAVGTPYLYDNEWGHVDTTSANHSDVSKYQLIMRVCPGDPLYGQAAAGGASFNAQNTRPPVDYAMVRYLPIVANEVMWKISQFNHPGTTILMADSPTIQYGVGSSTMSGYYAFTAVAGDLDQEPGQTLTQALQQRHLGIGNIAFLDGHVEQHNYGDYVKNIPSVIVNNLPIAADRGKIWTSITPP
jgi:prepilin-type N-terminal cleavage/methylation domain-containing protein/prepilin-type processing-associated H-X9-DG protein